MRIRWHGHSCFEIENGIVVVTDPHDGESIGLKQPRINADIVLVSHRHYDHNSVKTVSTEQTKVIDTIGKSTANGIEFFGIESAHDEQNGKKRGRNIIYKFKIGSVNFCHLGDLGHEVDDEKLKEIGKVDILFIPVGNIFTLTLEKALATIKKIKPKVVVPMHYRANGLSIGVKPLSEFLSIIDCYEKVKVGNEIEFEKRDLPMKTEVWLFS